MRTFLDSCVLIAAFQGKEEVARRAFEIIDDPDREFVISDFIKLELIPKPTFHRNQDEVDFYEAFFEEASLSIEPNQELASQAIDLASRYDLSPVDALHVSAATLAGAEYITAEKPEKPFSRVTEIPVGTIYPISV